MAKLSKRVRAYKEKIEAGKLYPIDEAVTLLNELSTVKFSESIEDISFSSKPPTRSSSCSVSSYGGQTK